LARTRSTSSRASSVTGRSPVIRVAASAIACASVASVLRPSPAVKTRVRADSARRVFGRGLRHRVPVSLTNRSLMTALDEYYSGSPILQFFQALKIWSYRRREVSCHDQSASGRPNMR